MKSLMQNALLTVYQIGTTIRFTWQAIPFFLLFMLALTVIQSLLSPLQLVLLKIVIDRISLESHLLGVTMSNWMMDIPLIVWIICTAIVIAVGQLLQPVAAMLQSMVADRLTGKLEEQLMLVLKRWHGLAYFEDPAIADDLQRIRSGSGRLGLDILSSTLSIVLQTFTIIGLMIVLWSLHPLAPVLLLIANLPQAIVEWSYVNSTASFLYLQAPRARGLQYAREVVLDPRPAKDVRLYNAGSFFQQRYEQLLTETQKPLEVRQSQKLLQVVAANTLATLATGLVYCYLVWLIVQGRFSIGDLALYGGATLLLSTGIREIGASLHLLPLMLNLIPAMIRILDATPDLPLATEPQPMPAVLQQGIIFDDVYFTYPGTKTAILQGVSFCIRPGESVALVGHNGAGKTTIIKLLLRMYDPVEGRILIDGVDLRDYDLADVRRTMGVIFQDFVRYELTAGENIGVGQVEALADQQRILQAAQRSGADEVLAVLPEGLNQQLGKLLNGRELSGGQWQKIALARAFMRDCQILVLDEPTAALDVQTEHAVYQQFSELVQECLVVLISHRFSTVRMAQHILLLENGRICEEGSHKTLMQLDGEYARLYRLQAAQYIDLDNSDNV